MFHQSLSSALRGSLSSVPPSDSPVVSAISSNGSPRSLHLVEGVSMSDPAGGILAFPNGSGTRQDSAKPRVFADVLSVSAGRFAAFCAEASVLVFVLGILDRFLLKERIEVGWIFGAFAISTVLLGLSIATDVGARRWLGIRRPGQATH